MNFILEKKKERQKQRLSDCMDSVLFLYKSFWSKKHHANLHIMWRRYYMTRVNWFVLLKTLKTESGSQQFKPTAFKILFISIYYLLQKYYVLYV